MAKEIEKPQTVPQKYSKSAFIDAAESNKDRLILQVVLEDVKSYTKDDVAKIVDEWKKKGVK